MTTAQDTPASTRPPSVLADEVAQFNRLAARWWDPSGPMAALHAMNPLRTGWIDRRIPPASRILDLGCGAGLAAEALARRGHAVLGLDAAPDAVAAARAHAAGQGLAVEYRTGAAEDLVAEGRTFPVITALEVIEHVANPRIFLRMLATLLEPGGTLFISTLNRTARSFLIAKVGAEYVARLLPLGTHDWRRFLTPRELAAQARPARLDLTESAGMTYNLLHREWRQSRDLSINYIAALVRSSAPPARLESVK